MKNSQVKHSDAWWREELMQKPNSEITRRRMPWWVKALMDDAHRKYPKDSLRFWIKELVFNNDKDYANNSTAGMIKAHMYSLKNEYPKDTRLWRLRNEIDAIVFCWAWSGKEIAELRSLKKNGYSCREIGHKLNKSYKSVYHQITRISERVPINKF